MKTFRTFVFWLFFKKSNKTFRISKFKIILSLFIILTIFPLLILLSGCYYYKVKTTNYPKAETISPLIKSDKIFVIHPTNGNFVIFNLKVENDSIKGKYANNYKFPVKTKILPKPNSNNRYRNNQGDSKIIKEVHIYIKKDSIAKNPEIAFALNDIYRFDIYDPNKGLTTLSSGCSTAGAIFLIASIIAVLSSCPFIYVNNADQFIFAGEIYSGAIYSSLERDDYLTLPQLVAENGKYKLKISNELQEIQHSNLLELFVIDHPAKSEVLMDKYGHIQTASDKKSPIKATNLSATNVLNEIKNKDSLSYAGISPFKDIPLTDGVIMTFDKPKDVTSGKLFIKAKNSLWLDYVYKNMHDLLGNYNDNWTKKQNKADGEKLRERALNQKIPLSIYIEKNGKWEFYDYFNMVGPMALKDDVIAIDLKDIESDFLKIKLESGSYFWEIDYAAIDYSSNIAVDLKTVQIDKAITEENIDVSKLIMHDDKEYYIQPETTNIAELNFPVPKSGDSQRTIILHSKGYYQLNHETTGFPKINKLKTLREPGQFLEYSKELMKSQIDKTMQYKSL